MVNDFIFDGRSLSSFGYIMFSNSDDTQNVSNMEMDTIKGARNDKAYSVGYKYGENYSATYSIMKNTCLNPEDEYLSDDDVSELTRWLCRKQYKWFKFIDDEADDEIWYKAMWTVSKEYAGDKIIGLDITIHTNAPYGFSKEIINTYTEPSFMVSIDSDEEGYIYPDVTIRVLSGGTLELTNTTEDRTTRLTNCVAGETIKLFGYEKQQIWSSVDHDFVNEYNYKFPRLCSEYANYRNEFTVNLDCEIVMKYREIRKVGLK